MIRALIHFSLQQRVLILALTLFVAGIGLWALSTLPVDAFPDLTNIQVNIVTEAPGLAPAEVEQLITFPIESAMMGLPRTEQVRSISKFGLSMVTVVFEDDVDIYFARQRVAERLQEVKARLPEGVEPTLGPVATAFGEIYQYTVEGEGYSLMELKTLHDWVIRPQLRTLPGVSEVNSWGGFIRQYHVLVDPERLLAYGLTLREVYEAIARSNANFGGGYVERGAEAYLIRGLGRLQSADDLRNVIITAKAGVPVRVADVATVDVGPALRHGAVTKNGRGEVVSGMVIMTKGENSKRVIERIKERVREIERTLPPGVRIVPFYDQTELIQRTTRTVATNLIKGGLLVLLVLVLFLHDLRAALIVAAVIPLSMLAAFIGMRALGLSANLMSLGAIDFGLLVDGAVVVIENFVRRRALHSNGPLQRASATELMRESTLEVARPMVFGVFIILAVYWPIFALQGMEARMFRPMALTVSLAIFASLILALTFVPALGSLLGARMSAPRHDRFFERVRQAYRRALLRTLRFRRLTIGAAVLLVALALFVLSRLGTEFMPELDEGALLIETRRLPSISLSESAEVAGRIERLLLEFPEVETVVTKIGRPDLATEAMGMYQGDVYVLLKPRQMWRTARTREELIEAMDRRLREIPGVTYNFTQPLAMRLDEVVSGVRSDVAVKLFGQDPEMLLELAETIRRLLERLPGAADVQIEPLLGARELRLELNRAEMARFGISVDDIAHLVETAIGGKVATQIIADAASREGSRNPDGNAIFSAPRVDVLVRLPEAHRRDPETIGQLLLQAPAGERVPLARLARITTAEGPEIINRENATRRIVIQANVRGRDLGGFVEEAQERLRHELRLPPGYYLAWGGQFENQQRAMRRLRLVVPLVVFLIFLLLFASFDDLPRALLIMVNLPFALVGGVAALWLRGLNVSLSAAVGFIALFGIAVLNGLVMVSAINRLREHGASLRQAVVEGAAMRLRPVLMTALVASLGFVPMATSTAPGAEVQRPLATVVIGGLVSSTMLTLFVLPLLYEWMERNRRRRRQSDPEREHRESIA
ncbi:MAG: CusA/CzcA family heavy metal efflux RND transporter [Blastocatellia bacterium]|nr:CusA/CzcA family heavy metal efflux RND transporter [Blastocatellia bacterium]MCS7156758.1 CusA/CzcA family heavy metal efflux RND transporter [Blastocatellia bacterium]MCX7751500.1 CusA/CzcA family heavy metal efflux RND transporter [Blastocatellia bacterium]MDW8168600.1 CusA/CzcA family heavy metal efflux RND transporter [Acidobacteriota bacterium]MDW8256565.1 CusA/CzcA family heavy metal efflux RND transporter [Acidobacteriota bacterium]